MIDIVLHYNVSSRLIEHLHQLRAEGLAVEVCDEADDHRFFDLMSNAQVLWHSLRPVTREVIARAPRLRLIQKIGVGVNTIDLEAARERGIAVCNMPGSNSNAVAEMTLLLMLATLRRLPLFDRRVRSGNQWATDAALTDQLSELRGRKVGLVGFGAIPTVLAPILAALGADVSYTSRARKPGASVPYQPLDDLLADSDIVSLHLPLVPETTHIIDASALARMKPGAILINTARGGLVDENALIAALTAGHLAGAGLDVLAHEPPPANHPLFKMDNVILAPHVAWLTRETLDRSLRIALENCRRLAGGEKLLHQVVPQ